MQTYFHFKAGMQNVIAILIHAIARCEHVIARSVHDIALSEHHVAIRKHRMHWRRVLIHSMFIIFSVPTFAQVENVESLMTRRYLSSSDVAYNISFLIPEYYKKGQKDTLQAIINYWEEHCRVDEELVRCKILLAIEEGSFGENLYSGVNILSMLKEYQYQNPVQNNQTVQWRYRYYRPNNDQYGNRINRFTSELAKKLLETNERSAEETFFLKVYANQCEDIYKELDEAYYDGTNIKTLYLQEKKARGQEAYFHNDWMLGIWIPHGNLEILGVHPSIGYRFGVKYRKLIVDLTIDLRFIKSPNTYQVYADNVIWDTDKFVGPYLGLDAAYELFRLKQNSMELTGGIGYDVFTCLNIEDDIYKNDRLTEDIGSLNLNIGLAYKFHFKNKRYIGIQFKYNFVNYRNPKGTNLDGNAYTVNLLIGNVFNRWW